LASLQKGKLRVDRSGSDQFGLLPFWGQTILNGKRIPSGFWKIMASEECRK